MRKENWSLLFISILSFFSILPATGQIATHITNFNHKDYNSGIQNWGTAISAERILYVGNNNGLLRYNGNDWTLLEPIERTTVRAVHTVGSRIYSAGNNNIGYWEPNALGEFTYTSLLPLANQLNVIGETFWSIGSYNGDVYFQSFGNILRYDGHQMEFLVKDDFYSLLFQSGDDLFVQKFGGSLLKIQDGKLAIVSSDPVFSKEEVKFVFGISPDKYFIGLSNGEIHILQNNTVSLYTRLTNKDHIPVRIDCGSIWKNEMLAVGTIGDGLFLLQLNDGKQTHIHSSQLQDLNIHSISFADENFLWLSLDNGISSIILDPEMYLWKSNSEIGTFFDAASFNGKTYIASNQGTFIYEEEGRKLQTPFFPLRFSNLKNELLCGTTTELYKMTTRQPYFTKLCDVNGVTQFEYIADRGNEYIYMLGYSGISLLHYKDNTWQYLSTVLGTDSYTGIMPENLHTVWAIHSEKGIFRLRINEEMNGITGFDNFPGIDGYSNYSNIFIVKVEEKILFATPKGFYLYDTVEKKFVRQDKLSRQIQYPDKLQAVKRAYKNNIWVAANDELFLYRLTDLSAEPALHLPFVHNAFTLYDRHLNLKSVNDSVAFISTFEGTIVINNSKINKSKPQPNTLRLETVSYTGKNDTTFLAASRSSGIEFPNTATNITFKFTTGLQTYPVSISYRLPGVSEKWSPWQSSGIIGFTNLPSGSYKLEVRDSNRNTLILPVDVSPPLYKRTWMILLYIIILVIFSVWIATYVNGRKQKVLLKQYEEEQRKHAEELQRHAYEQLQEKARNQESELKTRMRYLSQKQELLNTISSEIETQKKELGDRYPNKLYQRLMKIIKEGTTEKDKFLSFENYFVEVHHEFMLQMQKLHPALSASELKFCCLLRANLSTKEISAIMGIGIRSVELKRYRLKQRLGLDANSSLTSYILAI